MEKRLTDKEFKALKSKKVKGCGLCNDGDLSNGSLHTAPNWCSCPLGQKMKTLLANMSFEVVTYEFNQDIE